MSLGFLVCRADETTGQPVSTVLWRASESAALDSAHERAMRSALLVLEVFTDRAPRLVATVLAGTRP
jgi:hypothetical protein